MPVFVATILVPRVVAISAETADEARTRLLPEARKINGVLHSIEPHNPPAPQEPACSAPAPPPSPKP